MQNILLLGGPFHWKTMSLPKDFTGSELYLPLPVKPTWQESFSVLSDMTVAAYTRANELFFDCSPQGWIFYHRETR